MDDLDRRALLTRLGAALAMAPFIDLASAPPAAAEQSALTRVTLEAYADTIVPGAKRYAGDLAVAGAAAGPGAVDAGALSLLAYPDFGLAPLLPALAVAMNARVLPFAAKNLILLNPLQPPLVSLSYPQRVRFVHDIVESVFPDRLLWIGVGLLCGWAFDLAIHLHTAEALASRHPGLMWNRYPAPDADGLWRFEEFSYELPLAVPHPTTTPQGGPA